MGIVRKFGPKNRMRKHPKHYQIIDWLKTFKTRNKPLKINSAETIFNCEKFAKINIERIQKQITYKIYYNAINNTTRAKIAKDKERSL